MTKHIDPLHQLIQLFSRTALTEKWWVSFSLQLVYIYIFLDHIDVILSLI